MLGTVSGEQQRLRTRSDIRIGTFHAAKQQLANRHAKHSTAWLARDHAFAPLRLNVRTQPFNLRGFADASTPSKEMNMPCIFITLHCGVRNATAAHCYEQSTGLFITGRELRRDGCSFVGGKHSTSAFTVVGVEPISLAIRVLAQPLSANSRTLARRSARALSTEAALEVLEAWQHQPS